MVWATGLFTTARFIAASNEASSDATKREYGGKARREGRVADVGFALALIGGLWVLLPFASEYMRQPWMHLKLTLVAGLVALHAMVRIGAKRASEGRTPPAIGKAAVVMALQLAIVAVVTLKPFAR